MRFAVEETGEEVVAKERPVVVITSNNEKELPDAFLRRCVFHFIDFPTPELMRQIVEVHHPALDESLVQQAISAFYELRNDEAPAQAPVDQRADRLDRGAACGGNRGGRARRSDPVPRHAA